MQRKALRSERDIHPLLRRIMQIHVTEEARHLCFARHYLKAHVPRLGPVRRFILSRRAPFILAIMAQMMMRPSGQIVRTYGIPRAVIREAYTRNPRAPRAARSRRSARCATCCAEIGAGHAALGAAVAVSWASGTGRRPRRRGGGLTRPA